MGSKLYEKVSSGKFHDEWFEKLKENDFVDETSGEKISKEVLRLLNLQKEAMIKQLIKFPNLYYAKSHFPWKYHKEPQIICGECAKVMNCGAKKQKIIV